jgi:hypothetical protein
MTLLLGLKILCTEKYFLSVTKICLFQINIFVSRPNVHTMSSTYLSVSEKLTHACNTSTHWRFISSLFLKVNYIVALYKRRTA